MATQSADDHLNGCMIALMPTAEDANRLAVKGGENAADLHVTLFFLGDDAAVWDEDQRADLLYCLRLTMAWCPAGNITGNVFGAAHWNCMSDKPSWVWNVGEPMDDGRDPWAPMSLSYARSVAQDAIAQMHKSPPLPPQHSPWVPHICAAYTDDLSLLPELETKVGPVTFDRIRVSFGNEDHDFPLIDPDADNDNDTAMGRDTDMDAMMAGGGPVHRKLTPREVQARTDFAMIDRQWKDAVGSMMSDYDRVLADQRAELRAQITAAVDKDDLSAIDSLHVDTDACARLLREHMLRYARQAGTEMQREAEHQGVHVPPWDLESVTASTAVDVITATARVTARALGLNLIQSAVRKVMAVFGFTKSGRAVADAVDESIKGLSGAGPRDAIGAAMSTAQNAGRVAVLSAITEPATYVASEALDKNTCKPCRTIDGTEFTSLSAAREAYPSGGYASCQGGGRCRGTMIAVFGRGETASAAVERTDTVGTATETLGGKPSEGTTKDKRLKENQKTADDTEALGGKPNPGTKPDKRIKENKYGTDPCQGEDCDEETMSLDPGHFTGDTQALSTEGFAWDGSSSRFNDAQWKTATAACDTGDGTVKERCFLPHHDPGGALNQDGLAAAAGRVNQSGSHSAQAVAKAKAHLRSHYNALKKPVPDNLKATSDEIKSFGVEDGYDLTIWGPPVVFAASPDNECPPNMMKDDTTGECVPMSKDGTQATGQTAPWEGVLVVEGETTGDGREFAADALTWPDPIEPGEVLLRWNKVDSHGGVQQTQAVAVGRIDRIWKDGNKIMGQGVFDLANPDGAEAYRRVKDKFLRGVSIDADDVKNADVELVFPEVEADGEESIFDVLFAQPDKVVYHGGRIRAATLCDIPAFIEAYIALTDADGAVVAGGAPSLDDAIKVKNEIGRRRMSHRREVRKAAIVAHGGPDWRPPRAWFANPQLSVPTTIHVSDEGRVYGHAAQWEACHIGYMDACTKPPREDDFPYFLTGEVLTDDGTPVSVGQITVTTNHADLYAASGPAKEHYENTGNAVADVAVGADSHGIWVAGAIRPSADPALIHELRASGEVSGDWRRIGGQYRLVGLLGVNVGGFVVPNMQARVAGGHVQALIAAGRLNVARPHVRPAPMDRERAYKIVMDDLYAQMFSPDAEGSE